MSLSPPLPIWLRACSKLTSWPNLSMASCHASAWRSTESRSVPSGSKIAAFDNLQSSIVEASEFASCGTASYPLSIRYYEPHFGRQVLYAERLWQRCVPLWTMAFPRVASGEQYLDVWLHGQKPGLG